MLFSSINYIVLSAVQYASSCCVAVCKKLSRNLNKPSIDPKQNLGLNLLYNYHAVCIIFNCIHLLLNSDLLNVGRDECNKDKGYRQSY